MLKSMTGFGRAEILSEELNCKVETRSVNNRFIDIHIKLPKFLSTLDLKLKKLVKEKFARGSFDIHISFEKSTGENGRLEATADLEFAAQYFGAINKIKESQNLYGQIDINSILGIKEFIKFESPSLDTKYEKIVTDVTKKALDELSKMRGIEGENLQNDIESKIYLIKDNAYSINMRQPKVLSEYQEKLKERIKILGEGLELDNTRLLQEIAIIADRSDISEELTRIDSHLKQFLDFTNNTNNPIGRKLEFIVQEINRETNTIGSKSNDFEISQAVVEIKSNLEKIREQLQNIE